MSSAVGEGGREGMGFGIPPVSIPCWGNASCREASWNATSPAREWMAGLGCVAIRVMACGPLSTKGCTYLASLGFPTGRCRATMKPAVGSASIPAVGPNGARPWRVPRHIGAMVGSYALTMLPWVNDLPGVSRRDWCSIEY
jgi:hypothetical protein